ncbi:hypothetical protein K458DRAFT_450812 [Lentithecium fluviatile CBS 122367]|uniref:Uncharacterized protein n=1 Tax=Lentithecium fluviatile CBS 122367 TaxID=1168545 RepID=A0A6G1J2S0_9PLEO|nr:hypothetical protein K458DRAFT_450812 [Lentithecium fluviatile CBS 122367]
MDRRQRARFECWQAAFPRLHEMAREWKEASFESRKMAWRFGLEFLTEGQVEEAIVVCEEQRERLIANMPEGRRQRMGARNDNTYQASRSHNPLNNHRGGMHISSPFSRTSIPSTTTTTKLNPHTHKTPQSYKISPSNNLSKLSKTLTTTLKIATSKLLLPRSTYDRKQQDAKFEQFMCSLLECGTTGIPDIPPGLDIALLAEAQQARIRTYQKGCQAHVRWMRGQGLERERMEVPRWKYETAQELRWE